MREPELFVCEAERAAIAAAARSTPLPSAGRGVALHEAAHAVVGWVVGDMPIAEIALLDDGSGVVIHKNPLRDLGNDEGLLRARLERAIVTAYAGIEADDRSGLLEWERSVPDIRLVDRFASYLVAGPGRELAALKMRLQRASMRAVHDHWPAIESLALLLEREGRIRGCDGERWLRGICGPSGGYPLLEEDPCG